MPIGTLSAGRKKAMHINVEGWVEQTLVSCNLNAFTPFITSQRRIITGLINVDRALGYRKSAGEPAGGREKD